MSVMLATSPSILEPSQTILLNTDAFRKISAVASAVINLFLFKSPNTRLLHLSNSIQQFQDVTAIVGVIKGAQSINEERQAKKSCEEKIISGIFIGAYAVSNSLYLLSALHSLGILLLKKITPIRIAADLLTGVACIGDLFRIISTDLPKLKELNKEEKTWKEIELKKTAPDDKIQQKIKYLKREKHLLLARSLIDIALDVTVIALIALTGISLITTGSFTLSLLIGALAINTLDFSSCFMKEYLTKKLSLPEPKAS